MTKCWHFQLQSSNQQCYGLVGPELQLASNAIFNDESNLRPCLGVSLATSINHPEMFAEETVTAAANNDHCFVLSPQNTHSELVYSVYAEQLAETDHDLCFESFVLLVPFSSLEPLNNYNVAQNTNWYSDMCVS